MKPDADIAPRADGLRRVAVGVIWGLVPALFVGWLLAQSEGPMGFGARAMGILQRVMLVALASAVVGVAGLFGMRLLRLARIAPAPLFARFVLGAGLGLGVISLATLGIGCAGFLSAGTAIALVAVMFLVGHTELRAVGEWVRRPSPRFPRLSWLELALVAAGLFVLVLQLLVAFNLPTDYDACEYHMAAPWRWAQLGRIDWVEGNVYTNLPMNAEMLYLFSMELIGGGDWARQCLGVHLGVVMNLMTALLGTGAVYVLARRFFTRGAALAAAAFFFTLPGTMVSSTLNIHNEILLGAWATLSVYALMEFADTHLAKWVVLSAVFAGLAAGVKYTALAFFVPVIAAVAIIVLRKSSRVKAVGAGILCIAVVLLVLLPWLAKNYAFSGNPVYPFGYTWFGGRDWSAELDGRWFAGNYKAAGTDRSGNLLVAVWERVVMARWGSLGIAAFAMISLVRLRTVKRNGAGFVIWLWVFLVLWTLLWYFGTHRVDRFWMPFAGLAAVLAGCGFDAFERRDVRAVLVAGLVVVLAWQVYVDSRLFATNGTGNYDLLSDSEAHLSSQNHLYPALFIARDARVGSVVGEQGTTLLVAEARTLYLSPSTIASTVFNSEALTSIVGDAPDPAAVARRLRERHIRYVLVNWLEIGRLRKSYAMVGPDGRKVPGLPDITPAWFSALKPWAPEAGAMDWLPNVPQRQKWLTEDEVRGLPGGKAVWIYEVPASP